MTLLESLLDAIVRLEGDALVMHVGEKPYVVTTSSSMTAYRGPLAWGQVELSSRVLTTEAVMSMVAQILPVDQRQALEECGAIEHGIASPTGVDDRFTVVAARGGDDIWLELRRHPVPVGVPAAASAEPAAEQTTEPAMSAGAGMSATESLSSAVGLQEPPRYVEASHGRIQEPSEPRSDEPRTIEDRVPVFDEVGNHVPEHVEHVVIPVTPSDPQGPEALSDSTIESIEEESSVELIEPETQHVPTDEDVDAMLAATAAALLTSEGPPAAAISDNAAVPEFVVIEEETQLVEITADAGWAQGDAAQADEPLDLTAALNEIPRAQEEPVDTSATGANQQAAAPEESEEPPAASGVHGEPEIPVVVAQQSPFAGGPVSPAASDVSKGEPRVETKTSYAPAVEPRRAVVVPPSGGASKPGAPAAGARVEDAALLETLRTAAERGASIVYVVAQSKPMIRVDGEISALEDGAMLSAQDVERLVAALAPPQLAENAKTGPIEWVSDVPEVGRVRCVTFKDHRGPGLIFRMVSSRSISADHLALSPEIRDLCAQTEGLVVVSGPRGSGRSTLLAAFVDLVNRTRSDHIISIEEQIGFVHESRRSFVSQREVQGEQATAAAVLGAFKEDPDVLVIDDVHSAEVVSAALEAAESGRLVFMSITAPSAADAIPALLELFPEGQRVAARAALAGTLRAVVSQMLLRKLSGGRTAARELLYNTPAVSTLILEGKTTELPGALESGRKHGMVPLTDALASLVREGTVHGAEAYRKAPDRTSVLAALAREGVDTSFAERLA